MRTRRLRLLLLVLALGLGIGCRARPAEPTVAVPTLELDANAPQPATATPLPTPTLSLTRRPTPTSATMATIVPRLTRTAAPANEADAGVGAAGDLPLQLVSELTGKPIGAALVMVADRSATSGSDGAVILPGLAFGVAVSVSVQATGFLPLTRTVTPQSGMSPVVLLLADQVMLTIEQVNMRLRTGPGLDYATLGLAFPGDSFRAIGQSADGDWLLIDSPYAANTWIQRLDDAVRLTGDPDALPLVTVASTDNE